MAAEQRNLSRVRDACNIIALLKQEPAAGVDQDGASDLAMSWRAPGEVGARPVQRGLKLRVEP